MVQALLLKPCTSWRSTTCSGCLVSWSRVAVVFCLHCHFSFVVHLLLLSLSLPNHQDVVEKDNVKALALFFQAHGSLLRIWCSLVCIIAQFLTFTNTCTEKGSVEAEMALAMMNLYGLHDIVPQVDVLFAAAAMIFKPRFSLATIFHRTLRLGLSCWRVPSQR
jgi:hypothetical protein